MSFLPVLVVFVGAYLLIKLRFFFFVHPIATVKAIRIALSTKASRRNLALSLSGTLGVGNIVGVAIGLSIGGAGTVFWLIVSSAFSMTLKYCESALSAEMSTDSGLIGVFRTLFLRYGKYMTAIYSFALILLSLTLGSSIQVSAIINCAARFNIDSLLCVFLVSLFVLFVISRGRRAIKGLTAYLIPVASVVYLTLCFYVIFIRADKVMFVLSSISENAFTSHSVRGGVFGFLSNNAIREGFSRGLMSNEAGTGASSLANSEGIKTSHHAGLIGVVEVFFDTVVVCLLSSFAMLLTFDRDYKGLSGMEIVFSSFGSLFCGMGGYILLFSVTLFAISSIICWYYYGVKCVSFLGVKRVRIYSVIFILSCYFALWIDEITLVRISDFLLLVLTFLTSLVLIKSSDRIKRLSELGGLIRSSRD